MGSAAPARPGGQVSSRYDLTLQRVLKGGPPAYTKELVLADAMPCHVRRFTEFSGDVSGRWLEALAASSAGRNERHAELSQWLPELLKAQREDGHFGDPFASQGLRREDMAVLWGNGRLLVGLIEHHRASGEARSLDAARRLGDFAVKIAPEMNSPRVREQFAEGAFATGYICWTQWIEGLTALHGLTRQSRYLALAREISAQVERRPGEHAHGFLTSLRGVADLYEATREPALLAQAESEWQAVASSGNLFVAGTVPEAWAPKAVRTEGCAEADWLRLSLQLWRLTARLRYLEAAGRTLFNEFAMNQFGTGDFGHRPLAPTGVRTGAAEAQGGGSARAWWCCTLHGLRAFPDIFRHVWRDSGEGLCYDFPLEGEGRGKAMQVTAASALEQDGTVELEISRAGGASAPLFIRLPEWADRVEIESRGGAAEILLRDGWYRVTRSWQAGDRLQLRYAMRTRQERDSAGRVALFHGPWLLGVAEATDPFFFDEPHTQNRLRLGAGTGGTLRLTPARSGAHPFAVPVARFEVQYLPGGYPVQRNTAVLRPVSEQTGLRTCDWEYWFLTEGA
jgi:DUF1680 family protein